MISRGTYSTFLWNDDKNIKHIAHLPTFPILLMPVNEDDEAFILFITKHAVQYPNNGILLPDGAHHPIDDCTISRIEGDTTLDKQSSDVPSNGKTQQLLPVGAKVWHATKEKRQISIATEQPKDANATRYTIHPLNSQAHQAVDAKDISAITPSTSDIPNTATDMDPEIMTEYLTK